MPSFDDYRRIRINSGLLNGQVRKIQSDDIMEQTWNEDIQSRIAYLYDYYHDDEFDVMYDLHPEQSKTKIPVEIKYVQNAYHSLAKDAVDFHIQFKPSQDCKETIPYYEEMFTKIYDTQEWCGLYLDLPDNKGRYQRWLIVDKGFGDALQFDTWSILRCDYKFRWIMDNKKYSMWGVLRSQNSYNSGVWMDFKIQTPQDQQKFIVPLNRISERIVRDQRFIIDTNVDYPNVQPNVWEVTKMHRLAPNGLAMITLAEDKFDQFRDFPEYDEQGNIIGFYADYKESNINPAPETPEIEVEKHKKHKEDKCLISWSGLKPQLKVGGSYKTFTVNFYDKNDILIDVLPGEWQFEINDYELQEDDISTLDASSSTALEENQIKVKLANNLELLGKVLKIKYASETLTGELLVDIIGM